MVGIRAEWIKLTEFRQDWQRDWRELIEELQETELYKD